MVKNITFQSQTFTAANSLKQLRMIFITIIFKINLNIKQNYYYLFVNDIY